MCTMYGVSRIVIFYYHYETVIKPSLSGYLFHGCSRKFLAWSFKIGESTARKIIMETCQSLCDVLAESCKRLPSENEWCAIADAFADKWQSPNCTGAIDGKHINITCPPGCGSLYYNYKGHHSIVLLAICDADIKSKARIF